MAVSQDKSAEIFRRVERDQHVEIIPGTELMADIAGVHFVHAHNAAQATALVPQPSEDPHDPLVSNYTLQHVLPRHNWSIDRSSPVLPIKHLTGE